MVLAETHTQPAAGDEQWLDQIFSEDRISELAPALSHPVPGKNLHDLVTPYSRYEDTNLIVPRNVDEDWVYDTCGRNIERRFYRRREKERYAYDAEGFMTERSILRAGRLSVTMTFRYENKVPVEMKGVAFITDNTYQQVGEPVKEISIQL